MFKYQYNILHLKSMGSVHDILIWVVLKISICVWFNFFFFLATPMARRSSRTGDGICVRAATQATAGTTPVLNPLSRRETPWFNFSNTTKQHE